jgi:hypothetical protein
MRNSLVAPLAFLLLWNGGDRPGRGGGSVLAHDDDDDPDHTHDGAEEEAAAIVPTDGSVTSSKLQIHVSKQFPGALPLVFSSPRYHYLVVSVGNGIK